jgi:hypothetical protein
MLPKPPRRVQRLRALVAHVAAGSGLQADVATEVDVVTPHPDLLEAAAAAMVGGELDPRGVPREIVRELMRPEPGFLGYPDSPTETERLLADARAVPIERGNIPRGLFDPSTGRMTAAGQAELMRRKQAAVDAEDYRTAEYLKHTLAVLGPKNGATTAEDCVGSADDPRAAAELFFRNGFIILRDCFTPSAVAAMVAAWDAAEVSARPAWEHSRRASRAQPAVIPSWPQLKKATALQRRTHSYESECAVPYCGERRWNRPAWLPYESCAGTLHRVQQSVCWAPTLTTCTAALSPLGSHMTVLGCARNQEGVSVVSRKFYGAPH